jgi:cysteine desulfurase family protein (TIGR01976 family)
MGNLDLHWIRGQFPALELKVSGRNAVFLDGPGGTQVPQRVVDAMADYLICSNANTHGAFATSRRSDVLIEQAHHAMADFLGCSSEEVVFGPNMTTLTFLLSRAIGRGLSPGDEVVVTRLEHDANVAPWRAFEEQGVIVREVDIDVDDCTLNMDDFAEKINGRTRLVAVGYASNAVGTVNDVAEVIRRAHAVGALTFVDAVHYAPHGSIDVRALDTDFLACSPYKFFAPHQGVLYGKRKHLSHLRPYKVRPASEGLPDRWEIGTQNHEALAGVVAALEYLSELGERFAPGAIDRRGKLIAAMQSIQQYERGLTTRLIKGLLQIPGLTFYGLKEPSQFGWRTPTVSVRIAGHSPRQLAERLAERAIFAWDGNFYALGLTERLGIEASGGMLRLGLVHYNTEEEIARLLEGLNEIVKGSA